MKFKLPLIAAMFAIASLSACGGSSSSNNGPSTPVYSPATLVKNEVIVGTGAEATVGKNVKVHYTGWLYNTTVANFKGTQFDSSSGKDPLPFTVGVGVVPGFSQGVTGMKVGGKRTVFIPSELGYGAGGNVGIPPNSGLVFDIELVEVR